MASEQQPRAGEVWGDPADPESWVRIHSSVADCLLYCGWSEDRSGLLPAELFTSGRQRICPPPAAPPREWTAEDVTAEQASAWFREWNFMFDEDSPQSNDVKEMIAAAANVLGVPKPQPVAVDVDRLAKAIASEIDKWANDGSDMRDYTGLAADVLRRELSQPTAEGPGGGA